MRLEKVHFRNVGPFKDFQLDLSDYAGAKLIAVTGDNGAGKTTFLELALPGACYRSTPTRGSLADLATARDAMVESTFVNGARHTVRHLVDGISGKSESLVLDAAGSPELPDSKVRSYDTWAAKHLPAPEVLFTSVFGAQGADGFVGLKPGERKAVLLRCLGVERYEGLAERARERAKAMRLRVETLEARMADERARTPGGAAVAREQAQVALKGAEQLLEGAQADLTLHEAEALRVAELGRAEKAALARRAELEGALAVERLKLEDLAKRITNNRGILADAAKIAAAEQRVVELESAISEAEREASAMAHPLASYNTTIAAAKEHRAQCERAAQAARQRADRARARLADADKVAAAASKLEPAREIVAAARAAVVAAEAALSELRGRTLAGAEDRIGGLRKGLSDISAMESETDDVRQMGLVADNTLENDDAAARDAVEVPPRIAELEQQLYSGRVDLAGAERGLATLEALAARGPEMAAARADLAEADAAIDAALTQAKAEELRAQRAEGARVEASQKVAALDNTLADLRRELVPASQLASKAQPLANAKTRLSELEPLHRAVAAGIDRLKAEYSATPAPPPPPEAPDVAAYRKLVADCERAVRDAGAALAVATQREADEQASITRLIELERERAGLDGELADWTRLAADLGRDGLQAMVIDGAIPELNHLANELLHEAFGPRWTIDIRTQAVDAKGKRMLETLDVVVIDTEAGREGLAETLSGGERVIVQEAISLALTVLACRQNGVERPTLVRDESGAALSEGKAPQWIAMLRRAIDLIGADKCLFVSHTPATWELADARIHLGGAT